MPALEQGRDLRPPALVPGSASVTSRHIRSRAGRRRPASAGPGPTRLPYRPVWIVPPHRGGWHGVERLRRHDGFSRARWPLGEMTGLSEVTMQRTLSRPLRPPGRAGTQEQIRIAYATRCRIETSLSGSPARRRDAIRKPGLSLDPPERIVATASFLSQPDSWGDCSADDVRWSMGQPPRSALPCHGESSSPVTKESTRNADADTCEPHHRLPGW